MLGCFIAFWPFFLEWVSNGLGLGWFIGSNRVSEMSFGGLINEILLTFILYRERI